MRQIVVNEPNINLQYVYFNVVMFDGKTPALNKEGTRPQVNINNGGWTDQYINPLESMGFGRYRALLTDDAINTVGNIILSIYVSSNTLDSFGEDIEVVARLLQTNIFDTENSTNLTSLSYTTVPEAERYFATRLNSESWENAVPSDKVKALITATRDIDRLKFFGVKLSSSQSLEFPRKTNYYLNHVDRQFVLGSTVDDITANDPYRNTIAHPTTIVLTTVPNDIKIACCEIAYNYLDGVDIEQEMLNINVATQRFSAIHEAYGHATVIEAYRAGINSMKAWSYLKPYLSDPYELKLTRI